MSTYQEHLALQPRSFGHTGLTVYPLCVGCAELGNMPETFAYAVSEAQALSTLRAVFAGPITFIDTAASYGDGESERRIGIVLRELGGVPGGYLLSTKCDRDLKTGEFTGAQMRRSVERSLSLLGLSKLPLLFLHDPEHAPFEEITGPGGAISVMQAMQREGIVGHIGLAGGPVELMIRYVETGAFSALITHNRYTLLNRSASPLFDAAARRGMGICNAAPYGSGLLAKGPATYPRYAYQTASESLLRRARNIEAYCQQHQVPLAAAALQFSLRDPRIHSTIVGFTRPERIQQTLDLAAFPIPESFWPGLDTVSEPDQADPEANRWR